MKNLFDTTTYNEVMQRLSSLTPQSQRQWGKMDVAQMLAHNKEAFKVPLSDHPMHNIFGSINNDYVVASNSIFQVILLQIIICAGPGAKIAPPK